MSNKKNEEKISIDGVDYKLADLSKTAKEHIASIQFVDAQIQHINNEWAVADTAKIGYTNALKAELSSGVE